MIPQNSFIKLKDKITNSNDKRFHNAKYLLKIYKDVVWQVENRIHEFDAECYEFGGKHLNELVNCLINEDTMLNKEHFESRLRSINFSKSIIDIIDKAVFMIKKYPDNGDLYFDIIFYQYIYKDPLKEKEILVKLNLGKSTFYRKKREAINLFTIALWGYMLPISQQALSEQD